MSGIEQGEGGGEILERITLVVHCFEQDILASVGPSSLVQTYHHDVSCWHGYYHLFCTSEVGPIGT